MAHLNWSPCLELVSMLLQPSQRTSSSLTATGGVPTTVVGTAPRITIVAGFNTEEYRHGIEESPTIGGTTTTIISGMAILGTTSMFRQERQVVLMVDMAARGSKVSNLTSPTDPSLRWVASPSSSTEARLLSSTTDPSLRCVTSPSSSMEALLRSTTDTSSSFTYPMHPM